MKNGLKKASTAALAAIMFLAVLPLTPTDSFAASAVVGDYTIEYISNGTYATVTGCSGTGANLEVPQQLGGLTVTSIAANAFAESDYFITLTLPQTITSIGSGAFSGCDKLNDVIIPDSVVSIGESAFMNCRSLMTVDIGSGVTTLGIYAFGACPKLYTIGVDPNNTAFSSSNRMLMDKSGSRLIQYAGDGGAVTIPPEITIVGNGAFFGLSTVTDIRFVSAVTTIGAYAFSGCLSLKSIVIPDSVTSLGTGCFMNCSILETVTLGSGIGVIPIKCFSLCGNLKNIEITNKISVIRDEAFYGCMMLEELAIPSTVSSIGNAGAGLYYNLRQNSNDVIPNFFISGTTGSAAQTYAVANNIKFVDYNKIIAGDADGNAVVDAIDASITLSEYASMSSGSGSTLKSYERLAADFDVNGVIDAIDASLILEAYAQASIGK